MSFFVFFTIFIYLYEFKMILLKGMLKKALRPPPKLEELKTEIAELRRRRESIVIANEFAAFARLQRRLDALKNLLKKEEKSYATYYSERAGVFQVILDIIFNSTIGYSVYDSYNVPVISVNPNWLWPLSGILKYPLENDGEISTISYFVIVLNSAKLIKAAFFGNDI